MNKTLSIVLILSFLLNSFAFAANSDDTPSIGDIIGNVLEGENSYKTYKFIAESEQTVCVDKTQNVLKDNIDSNAFYQGWSLNCLVVNNSKLCSDVRKDDKLICDQPAKVPWYSNIWEKTKSCGAGIKKSWEDYFNFIKQIGYYITNKEVEVKNKDGSVTKVGTRTKTNESISKAWTSMKNYMATEMTKYQDKYNVGKSKAFFAVVGNMLSKFTKGLNKIIAQAAPKVGCYNYKAKTRVICQVLAEFFAEPILMFKFIKMGPKVLKGTRVAKFFSFHKGNIVRKVAKTSDKAADAAKLVITKSKPTAKSLDFIAVESKVTKQIMKHPDLHASVASNKKVFREIFPDKKSLDQLDIYLSSTSKQEADDLAEVLRVLNEDRAKMTPDEYKAFIDDVKKGIKTSCDT